VGNGLEGQEVVFEVIEGGGDFGGESQKTITTNGLGLAQAVLTIGPNEGVTNKVRVTADGLTGSPLYFEADALGGVASKLVKVSGDSASATVGQTLAAPFVVQVTDPFGNPKENVEVTFVVVGGDGNINGSTSSVVASNAQGFAQAILALGLEAGVFNQIVEARSPGLEGSPIIFRASANADDAAILIKT